MRVFAPLVALFSAAHLASAGLIIVQEADQISPVGGKTEMTVRIEGDRARVDVGREFSSVVDLAGNRVTSLIHAQKMAMELPAGTLEAVKAAAATKTEKPDLKPTGKRETISGFACEEYVGTFQGLGLTYWVTDAVPHQKEILAQLGRLSGGADPFQGALTGGKFPGFPIRTTVKSKDHGSSTMTVLSITQADLPADVFAVPADYKSMAVPSAPPVGP